MAEIKARSLRRQNDTTSLYCPHCDTKFYNRDMWTGLAKRYKNARVIADMLGVTDGYVWNFIIKYRLVKEMSVPSRRIRPDWKEVARSKGYKTAQRMFWVLRIQKGWNWQWIANYLEVKDDDELKLACRAFLSGETK